MKKFLTLSIAVLITSASFAQSTEDSIKQVVNDMFTAMKTSDVFLFKRCFDDSAFLQTIATDRTTAKMKVKNEDLGAFAKMVGELPKNAADERITFESIKVDGDIATVWTPYKFYFNENFSHCGVNSFLMVRLNGLWKIHYLIDTRRKDNCPN